MRVNKKDINVFLALWLKSDPKLWGELRDIQIKILHERIIKEMTFAQISTINKIPEKKLKLIFQAIIKRIEIALGKEVSCQISLLNKQIENNSRLKYDLELYQVFPN